MVGLGIGLKGIVVVHVGLDEGVGVGPRNRDSEEFTGPDITGGVKPTDVGRPCSPNRRVEFLGTPGPEFHDALVSNHGPDPGRLRRNHNLVVEDV